MNEMKPQYVMLHMVTASAVNEHVVFEHINCAEEAGPRDLVMWDVWVRGGAEGSEPPAWEEVEEYAAMFFSRAAAMAYAKPLADALGVELDEY